MPENKRTEQLDQAIDALLARRNHIPAAAGTADIAPLTQIAADLRDLPRGDLKLRLRSKLERSATMGSSAAATTPSASASLTKISVKPYLSVRDAGAAIEFYKTAFGAVETFRLPDPQGKIAHATIQIGDAEISLADSAPYPGSPDPESLGGSPVRLMITVPDVDNFVRRAVAAGAKILIPVADQFYGARSGRIADPYGHVWVVSTPIQDVPLDEVQRRYDDLVKEEAQMQAGEKVAEKTNYVRKGFRSVTPYFVVDGAGKLMEFVKTAFGAEETFRMPGPEGKLMHAEARIGGSMIAAADANPQYPAKPMPMHLYVDDVDATYERALAAGATSLGAPVDQEYGERGGAIVDPCGNNWYIATAKGATSVPAGVPNLMPYLQPRGAARMIEFLQSAFRAEIVERHDAPDGTVAHAKMRIGDGIVELSDAHGKYVPMPGVLLLYVPDVDAVYRSALDAGAKSLSAPVDQPYGDRSGGVVDPFGDYWFISTHFKDVV
jgi:PhnB protein